VGIQHEARRCAEALATSIFHSLGLGHCKAPQYCPYKGVSVLSGGSFLEQVSLGVVHADNLVDPSNEGGDLDIHPWHVFSPTAEAPRNKACEFMVARVLAD